MSQVPRRRVLTGMRTTGVLHLGHYDGALRKWLEYQENADSENFFLLADYQALTTHSDHPEILTTSVVDVALDWLAVGLDPTRNDVHFVQQSQIPERHELSMLLQMVAKWSDIKDIPTVRTELKNLKTEETVGFFAYPCDQAADVFMVQPVPSAKYDRVIVPVGDDQRSILERCNKIVNRFNTQYKVELFRPCIIVSGEKGTLKGIDGQEKMGKSLNNAINLTDSPEVVHKKIHERMFTDPNHLRVSDAGTTAGNMVFEYLRKFDPDQATVEQLAIDYETPGVRLGDVQLKNRLVNVLNEMLAPIQERRSKFSRSDVRDIVMSGTSRARELCVPVLDEVRRLMHVGFPA